MECAASLSIFDGLPVKPIEQEGASSSDFCASPEGAVRGLRTHLPLQQNSCRRIIYRKAFQGEKEERRALEKLCLIPEDNEGDGGPEPENPPALSADINTMLDCIA